MPDNDRKAELQRALARVTAVRRQIDETRKHLQKHASAKLDASNARVGVTADHMARDPNVLSQRFTKTQITENARLRAIALRAEGTRQTDGDD